MSYDSTMMLKQESPKILVIQTAFIGDTILASHFAAEVHQNFPQHEIHFLLRKGNEIVIEGLNSVSRVWIWDKSQGRYLALFRLISQLRKFHFDFVFNLHRHGSSGLVTAAVHADIKVGFKENPLSYFFDHRVRHRIPYQIGDLYLHEIDRNLELLQVVRADLGIVPLLGRRPLLPLTDKIHESLKEKVPDVIQKKNYVVVAPASVWFTKAWSEDQFTLLVSKLSQSCDVFLVGAPSDRELCQRILCNAEADLDLELSKTRSQATTHSISTQTEKIGFKIVNLAGMLSLLETAALMSKAKRVFVNDSAPLHLASAVNAPTTAVFCSTTPKFGYYPLADQSYSIELSKEETKQLGCRPCGLHGHNACPRGHFKCSKMIQVEQVLNPSQDFLVK